MRQLSYTYDLGRSVVSPTLAHVVLPAIIALSILLIRPKGIPEVYWAAGGALLLVVLRLTPVKLASRAVAEGTDVYLFLVGMMLLSELAKENGVLDWLSSVAMRSAKGSCSRLFTLVYQEQSTPAGKGNKLGNYPSGWRPLCHGRCC